MAHERPFAIRDLRRQSWFSIDNEIIDKFGCHLGAYGISVYCVLCRYAKNENQQVNLSNRDIAASLGISHDRVRKSLAEMADVGLIHLSAPERPAPGLISTITLLSVKETGRDASSSPGQLDVVRARNKERKTKTNTETELPLTPLFEGAINLTSRDHRRFFEELDRIYKARQGMVFEEDEAIRAACEITGTPLATARDWIALSRGEVKTA